VLALYDALLRWRDDAVVRLNRAVAVAEVSGPALALAEVDWLDSIAFRDFGPVPRGARRPAGPAGTGGEAMAAYDRALALDPAPAERLWLERRGEGAMRRPPGPRWNGGPLESFAEISRSRRSPG
jgi:RNA polymerase sigma-70 factor (ECF subfamily)